jgi:ABC-type phosphate transport system substrate-binding protein
MPRPICICVAVALAVMLPAAHAASRESPHEFKVIVHPGNPTNAIERDWLRDAFLKKVITWEHGPAIQPIDLAAPSSTQEHFARTVLQKSPAALRAYWTQRIFSGVDLPPQQARSAREVIEHIVRTPGAVAYLPAHVDPGGAKVVDIAEE